MKSVKAAVATSLLLLVSLVAIGGVAQAEASQTNAGFHLGGTDFDTIGLSASHSTPQLTLNLVVAKPGDSGSFGDYNHLYVAFPVLSKGEAPEFGLSLGAYRDRTATDDKYEFGIGVVAGEISSTAIAKDSVRMVLRYYVAYLSGGDAVAGVALEF